MQDLQLGGGQPAPPPDVRRPRVDPWFVLLVLAVAGASSPSTPWPWIALLILALGAARVRCGVQLTAWAGANDDGLEE